MTLRLWSGVVLLVAVPIAAAQTVYVTPQLTFGNAWNSTATVDVDWVSPWEARFDNNVYTTALIPFWDVEGTQRFSERLRVLNISPGLPVDATVVGIEVSIHRSASLNSTTGRIRDDTVRLDKNGVLVGSNKAATAVFWPTTEAVAVYGGASDLWGTTWAVSDLGSTFGVQIRATNTGTANNVTARIDYVTVRIFYTIPEDEGITEEQADVLIQRAQQVEQRLASFVPAVQGGIGFGMVVLLVASSGTVAVLWRVLKS